LCQWFKASTEKHAEDVGMPPRQGCRHDAHATHICVARTISLFSLLAFLQDAHNTGGVEVVEGVRRSGRLEL
jgi:hypothetical protein